MRLSIHRVAFFVFGACLTAYASAGATAMGGNDNQLWVDSMGGDVTYTTNPINFNNQSDVTGGGFAAGSNTTNNPSSGGTYFNTNSFALASGVGTAYEESGIGLLYTFTNNGSATESVKLSWQGLVVVSATASGPGASAWDYGSSFVYDLGANYFAFNLYAFLHSSDAPITPQFDSGDYTFNLGAGQSDVIQSEAYNQAYAQVTPEPASYLTFGLGLGGLLLARRRRNRA